MPNVNIFELEACLEALNTFCEKYKRKSYVADNLALMLRTRAELREAFEESDRIYLQWRNFSGAKTRDLKNLQKAHKSAQEKLKAAGVTDCPTTVVSYWDEAETLKAVQEMIHFLQERAEKLDFAEESLEILRKHQGKVESNGQEGIIAYKSYKRSALRRKAAVGLATRTIGAMRRSIRSDLGKHHEDYKEIFWPATVEPDGVRGFFS